MIRAVTVVTGFAIGKSLPEQSLTRLSLRTGFAGRRCNLGGSRFSVVPQTLARLPLLLSGGRALPRIITIMRGARTFGREKHFFGHQTSSGKSEGRGGVSPLRPSGCQRS